MEGQKISNWWGVYAGPPPPLHCRCMHPISPPPPPLVRCRLHAYVFIIKSYIHMCWNYRQETVSLKHTLKLRRNLEPSFVFRCHFNLSHVNYCIWSSTVTLYLCTSAFKCLCTSAKKCLCTSAKKCPLHLCISAFKGRRQIWIADRKHY